MAAVASNVIPEAEHLGTITGILSGLAAGGLMMIGLKWLVLKLEREERSRHKLPVGLASAAAVDTLLDGTLIGAGFLADQRLGTVLAFALAIELFFLTLSVGVEFRKGQVKGRQALAVTSGIAILLLVGALGASILLEGASETILAVVLAFGAEELLVETIEAEESLFSTATLFSGFLLLLALKLLSQNNP